MKLLDQHMRKRLPLWILEGLEKAELDKQKKLELEQDLKKKDEQDRVREEKRAKKGLGKFVSFSIYTLFCFKYCQYIPFL